MAKRYVDPNKTKVELDLVQSKIRSLQLQGTTNKAKIDRLAKANTDIQAKLEKLKKRATCLQNLLGQ